MLEYLAVPAWNNRPTLLETWVSQLTKASGSPVAVTREGSGVAWLDLGPLQVRGYVQIENGKVAAINFELQGLDPEPAIRVIEAASSALRWELYPDEKEKDEDDEADDEDDDD